MWNAGFGARGGFMRGGRGRGYGYGFAPGPVGSFGRGLARGYRAGAPYQPLGEEQRRAMLEDEIELLERQLETLRRERDTAPGPDEPEA
jgi:hypothetical protein